MQGLVRGDVFAGRLVVVVECIQTGHGNEVGNLGRDGLIAAFGFDQPIAR